VTYTSPEAAAAFNAVLVELLPGPPMGAVAMSATAALTATPLGSVSGAIAMSAGTSASVTGHDVRAVAGVSLARTRHGYAVNNGTVFVNESADGEGWESTARTREGSATCSLEPVVEPEPEHHQRIRMQWIDTDGPSFPGPNERFPISDAWLDVEYHNEVWGRYRVLVSHVDVTYFRGAQTIIGNLSDTDPGGDDTLTLMFPTIGPYEIIGLDDLDWLTADHHDRHIPVRIEHIAPDGTRTTHFEGDGIAPEDGYDGNTSSFTLHCVGTAKTLDDRITKPRFDIDPIDIGVAVHRMVQAEVRYDWPGHAPGAIETGVPSDGTGAYGDPLWSGTIVNLIAAAQPDEDTNYTLMPKRPRGLQWLVRDPVTVDFSLWVGQPGVTHSLTQDYSRRFDAVYGEGATNGIRNWRSTQYPDAVAAGDYPPYPIDPAITFSVGDSDADLSLFFDELGSRNYRIESKDTYLASDLSQVEQFQDDAGITIDGEIGPQTWNAAFTPGLDHHVLDAWVRPLAIRQQASKFLYNDRGGVIGLNPFYSGRMRREVLRQYGTLSRWQGHLSAHREILATAGSQYYGTIVATNMDPPEMCALDTRAGMNMTFRHHRGKDRLLHVARVDRVPGMDGGNRTVTWTVSESQEDYVTLAERIDRRRAATDIAGRTRPRRNTSHHTPDFAPFDWEAGGGVLLPIAVFGGLWSIVPIPAGQRGSIVHTRLVADRPVKISAAVFNWRTVPRQLNALPGLANPNVGTGGTNAPDPWQANAKALSDNPVYADQPWLAWASGALDSMQGYWDHEPGADSVLTGVLDDSFTYPYHSRRSPWLFMAIWCSESCVIGGDPDYGHRVLWNAPDTG
jgi:hypothetical protein